MCLRNRGEKEGGDFRRRMIDSILMRGRDGRNKRS
jgi:hypothetical protein